MPLITEAYRTLNTALHEARPDYGTSSAQHAPQILRFARLLGTESMLDYGCGKGVLKPALAAMCSIPVAEYDPAIAGKDAPPEKADLVVCSDVLEHVEPECIDAVLDDLQRLALRGAFLAIALRPAKKRLADGRNAHILLRDPRWWLYRILARFDVTLFSAIDGKTAFALCVTWTPMASPPVQLRPVT